MKNRRNTVIFLKRVTAALLSAAMVLSNLGFGGTGSISSKANTEGETSAWSASAMMEKTGKAELYDAVKEYYTVAGTTDANAGKKEIWSRGAEQDFADIEFKDPVYSDGNKSAEVEIDITPVNADTKINYVRTAGYFGNEGYATLSDAAEASPANASGSNAGRKTWKFLTNVSWNDPAFVIYYTIPTEDKNGKLQWNAMDSEWVVEDDAVTDIAATAKKKIRMLALKDSDITLQWQKGGLFLKTGDLSTPLDIYAKLGVYTTLQDFFNANPTYISGTDSTGNYYVVGTMAVETSDADMTKTGDYTVTYGGELYNCGTDWSKYEDVNKDVAMSVNIHIVADDIYEVESAPAYMTINDNKANYNWVFKHRYTDEETTVDGSQVTVDNTKGGYQDWSYTLDGQTLTGKVFVVDPQWSGLTPAVLTVSEASAFDYLASASCADGTSKEDYTVSIKDWGGLNRTSPKPGTYTLTYAAENTSEAEISTIKRTITIVDSTMTGGTLEVSELKNPAADPIVERADISPTEQSSIFDITFQPNNNKKGRYFKLILPASLTVNGQIDVSGGYISKVDVTRENSCTVITGYYADGVECSQAGSSLSVYAAYDVTKDPGFPDYQSGKDIKTAPIEFYASSAEDGDTPYNAGSTEGTPVRKAVSTINLKETAGTVNPLLGLKTEEQYGGLYTEKILDISNRYDDNDETAYKNAYYDKGAVFLHYFIKSDGIVTGSPVTYTLETEIPSAFELSGDFRSGLTDAKEIAKNGKRYAVLTYTESSCGDAKTGYERWFRLPFKRNTSMDPDQLAAGSQFSIASKLAANYNGEVIESTDETVNLSVEESYSEYWISNSTGDIQKEDVGLNVLPTFTYQNNSSSIFAQFRVGSGLFDPYAFDRPDAIDFLTDATIVVDFPHEIQPKEGGVLYCNNIGGKNYNKNTASSIKITYYSGDTETYTEEMMSPNQTYRNLKNQKGKGDIQRIEIHYDQMINGPFVAKDGVTVSKTWNNGNPFESGQIIPGTRISYCGKKASDQSEVKGSFSYFYKIADAPKPVLNIKAENENLGNIYPGYYKICNTGNPTILNNPVLAVNFDSATERNSGRNLTRQEILDYLSKGIGVSRSNNQVVYHLWAEVDNVERDITQGFTGKITSNTVYLKASGTTVIPAGDYILGGYHDLGLSLTPPYLSSAEEPHDNNNHYFDLHATMTWVDDKYTKDEDGGSTTLHMVRWVEDVLSHSAAYTVTNDKNIAYQGGKASASIEITEKTRSDVWNFDSQRVGETYYLKIAHSDDLTPILSSFKFYYCNGTNSTYTFDPDAVATYVRDGVYKVTPSVSRGKLSRNGEHIDAKITFDYDVARSTRKGEGYLIPAVTLYSYKGELVKGSVNGSADSKNPGRYMTLQDPVVFAEGTENKTEPVYLTASLSGPAIDIAESADIGAAINPGKLVKGTSEYYYDRDMITFKPDEKDNLSAKISMTSSDQPMKNVTLVLNVPDVQNDTQYILTDENKVQSRNTKANDYTMALKSVIVQQGGAAIPYTATYYRAGTYDSTNKIWKFNESDSLGTSDETGTSTLTDASRVKYVKISIPALLGKQTMTATAFLSAGTKTKSGTENAYIAMDWSGTIDDGSEVVQKGGSNLATYEYQDYKISGNIWQDANEDGMKDSSETGSAGQTVELWQDTDGDGTPDTKIMSADGKTPATVTTDADGNYSIGTPVAENVYLKLVPAKGYVISKDEKLAQATVDNGFDRTSGYIQVSGDGTAGKKPALTGDVSSVIGAVALLPEIRVDDLTVQPGKKATTSDAVVTNGVDEKNLTFTYDTAAADTSAVTGITDNGDRTATVTAAENADGKDTTAKLTVTNSLGDKVTVDYKIHVANKPTVSATDVKIYTGETPHMIVNSADKEDTVPTLTYSYYRADGTEVKDASDLSGMDTTKPGDYLVKVTATDRDGNSTDTYAWVQVYGKTTIDTGNPLTTRKNAKVTDTDAKTGVTASYEKPADATPADASQFTPEGAVNQKTTPVDVTDKVKVTTDLTTITTKDPEAYKTENGIGYTVPGALQTDETVPDAGSVNGSKDVYVQGNPVIAAENNSLDTQHATSSDTLEEVIKTGKGSETKNPASAYVYYVDKDGNLHKVDIDPSEIKYRSVTDKDGNPFTPNKDGIYNVSLTVDDSSVLTDWMKNEGGFPEGTYATVSETSAVPTVNVTAAHYSIEQDPPVAKTITGGTDAYNNASVFTFRMKAVTAGAPMPDGSANGVKTMTRKGAGAVEFGAVKYTEADADHTYEYTLSEDTGSRSYTYDKTVYTMKVEIGYNADKTGLEKKVSYTRKDGTAVGTMTFANTFASDGGPSGGDGGGNGGSGVVVTGAVKVTEAAVPAGAGETEETLQNPLTDIGPDGIPLGGFPLKGILPKTGEEWNRFILSLLLAAGFAGVLVLIGIRRKKENEEK